MKEKVVRNELREDEVITLDNVKKIGERIACKALKTVLAHSYNNRLVKLYVGLVNDIARVNNPNHIFSDGYDIAQEATCFLCDYIGKRLNEVCGISVRGKAVTIQKACFSRINQTIMRERKDSYAIVSNERPEVINLSVSFKEELEEDWTCVDEIIQRMRLTELQYETLSCYLAGMHFEEIVRYFGIAECSLWFRRKAIQKKYLKYILKEK